MARIIDLKAREILDSRGNPTVECDILLENGIKATASVPSGASTGSREALELRDKDNNRYHGKGVTLAVANINEYIKPHLLGVELNQVAVDEILLKLDNTQNKSILGANATLAVSLASLKALAKQDKKELYEYVTTGKVSLPIPMMNIINGGKHADNGLNIQEFMIVPVMKSFKEKLRAGSEIFHTLKDILKEQNLNTGVGDEGGFAPNLSYNGIALDLIMEAINRSNYIPGKDVYLALDVAASEIYDAETMTYKIDDSALSSDELINYYKYLVESYPIISIEDPFDEDDFESLAKLTSEIGDQVMLVGDDFFVTNEQYLLKGIEMQAGNAILLKANQVGTITEMTKTIMTARKNNYRMIISHRSGETEDTFISDLAVGMNIPYIKTGSLSRGERIAKYNRLLRIEEELASK
ncbi:MAG: phosphopyruvate hydratase [Bacilli bacterium]|nr:phosphopyruvate hydratase [Bacilli bacterium]